MRSLAIVATAALIVAAASGFVRAVPVPEDNHHKLNTPVVPSVCHIYDDGKDIVVTRPATAPECMKIYMEDEDEDEDEGDLQDEITKRGFAKKRGLAVDVSAGLNPIAPIPVPLPTVSTTLNVGIDPGAVPTDGLPLPQPTVPPGPNTGVVARRGDDRGSGPSCNGGL